MKLALFYALLASFAYLKVDKLLPRLKNYRLTENLELVAQINIHNESKWLWRQGLLPSITFLRDTHEPTLLYAAVKGTWSLSIMMKNLDFAMCSINESIKVHCGLYSIYKIILPELLVQLDKIPHEKLIFVGHSLGGALSQLISFSLQDKYNYGSLQVYSFGAPLVGNASFVEQYKVQTVLYQNCNDIVPSLLQTNKFKVFAARFIFGIDLETYRPVVQPTMLSSRTLSQQLLGHFFYESVYFGSGDYLELLS